MRALRSPSPVGDESQCITLLFINPHAHASTGSDGCDAREQAGPHLRNAPAAAGAVALGQELHRRGQRRGCDGPRHELSRRARRGPDGKPRQRVLHEVARELPLPARRSHGLPDTGPGRLTDVTVYSGMFAWVGLSVRCAQAGSGGHQALQFRHLRHLTYTTCCSNSSDVSSDSVAPHVAANARCQHSDTALSGNIRGARPPCRSRVKRTLSSRGCALRRRNPRRSPCDPRACIASYSPCTGTCTDHALGLHCSPLCLYVALHSTQWRMLAEHRTLH